MKNIFSGIAAWCFFVGIFFFFLRPLSGDADFYHHIHTGRYVVTNYRLPAVDEWTFTARGLPWVAHSWLGGVVFYLVFERWGYIGVGILLAAIATITFYFAFLWLRTLKIPRTIIFAILGLTASVVATRWPNRPEVFAYPLLISLFLVDVWTKRLSRFVWLFPFIILLWANLYGANVIVGLVIIGLLVARKYLSDNRKVSPTAKSYYLAALLALPLSLINGYGLRTVFYVLYLGKIATYQGEWAGIWDTLQKAPLQYVLTFQYLALTYFTYLALTVFFCLVSISKLKKHPFYLFLSTSLVVPLVAFRQAPLVTLLSLPLLALLVKDLPQRLRSIVIFLIFCIAVGLGWLSVWIKPVGLPVAVDTEGDILVTFLRTHELTGKTFVNQRLGSYLSYYLDPDVKVFVDTRDDLFLPTQVFPDILGKESVLTLAQIYEVDQFVLDFADDGPRFQPLLYSRAWMPVFVNNEHLVVVREGIARAKGLAVLGAIDPFSNTGAKVGLERQALAQYGKGQNPSYQISLALALGKYDQAKKLIEVSPLPLGPSRPLAEILNHEMLSEIAIYQNDCTGLMASVNRIKNSQRSKFLFSPKRLLPSNIGKYAAFAALLCDGDREKAKKQLQQFLSQSRNSLIVEDKLWRQFDNAATDVRPRDLP